MKRNLLTALLVLCSLILAQAPSRKATITSTDGSVQEMLIIEDNLDNIKIITQDSNVTMPKSNISSITYQDKDIKNNPLQNKKFGVEINLARFVLTNVLEPTFWLNNNKFISASGTLSFFSIDRKAEIAFPFFYSKRKEDVESYYKETANLETYTLDCHYRYFLNFFDNLQNGFYISAAARYAHLYGTMNSSYDYYDGHGSHIPQKGSEDKFGIGFGFGYRVFSKKGLYWGFSFTVGHYLVGEIDRFRNGNFLNDYIIFDDDNKTILDFELLKFGWAF